MILGTEDYRGVTGGVLREDRGEFTYRGSFIRKRGDPLMNWVME